VKLGSPNFMESIFHCSGYYLWEIPHDTSWPRNRAGNC